MKLNITLILFSLLSLSSFGQKVVHHAYITYYNPRIKEPDSVIWNLTPKMVACGKQTRVDLFGPDPKIEHCAVKSDYEVNAGKPQSLKIDLGHLFNFEEAQCDSTDRIECFYLSNMLPQFDSFNKGDWKSLEIEEQKWAKTSSLHIIAGGSGSLGKLPAGENIPKFIWKVIRKDGRWTAWIMPNSPTSKGHKYTYWQKPLDSLNKLTGLKLTNISLKTKLMLATAPTIAPATGTDAWQAIVTILFALSLISERISNVFKLWWTKAEMSVGTLKQRKTHENNVLWIAILGGMITSFVAGADLFHMINYHNQLLFFSGLFIASTGESITQHVCGAILTAFFISLGSKFWHDMLDIVLQFSNLKKSQSDQAMQSVQQQASDTQASTVAKLDAMSAWLRTLPGFSGYRIDPSGGTVSIFFDKDTPITDADKATLSATLGMGTFNILSSNIRLA
ncbi:DNA/RNA non-specific endonuclease [Mucilaginibacter celer]|uniref:DNA/RNA non-specific endonuclease n=1 Tax=Mucilaginibacter celer TaxID=2305508 RepID=A0A494VS89_9SPHI|nr:DNA/RNA non-specific endonuclease [Mucilaginibacter celer]AYL94235.1 DNA/RNA non-specific endonuclease [Mucilaginibacter celer]